MIYSDPLEPRALNDRLPIRAMGLAGALAALLLSACGSSSSQPATRRDLVIANPVSVSPRLQRQQTGPAPARVESSQPMTLNAAPVAVRPGAWSTPPRSSEQLRQPPQGSSGRVTDGTQIQSSIRVSAEPQPTTESKPQTQAQTQPKVQPTPAGDDGATEAPAAAKADDWWTRPPQAQPGRIRIVASGEGNSLRSARQAAVEAALSELKSRLGAPPEDVRYERTTVLPVAGGGLRGYVLASCDAP